MKWIGRISAVTAGVMLALWLAVIDLAAWVEGFSLWQHTLLGFLALAYMVELVMLGRSRRWGILGVLIAMPVVVASFVIVNALWPRIILKHDFRSGSTLILSYNKPYGLLQSLSGVGDLVYEIDNRSSTQKGDLIRSMDLPCYWCFNVAVSNAECLVVEDLHNKKKWKFTSMGTMEVMDVQRTPAGDRLKAPPEE